MCFRFVEELSSAEQPEIEFEQKLDNRGQELVPRILAKFPGSRMCPVLGSSVALLSSPTGLLLLE
jgi:hypothetical protein